MSANKETSVGIKLVADLRNYQKGMDTAKKKSKAFGKEAKEHMGSARDAITRLARGDITALPALFKSSTAAAGGFSKGLKGLKAALISTGIGAIIVGLGTAIGALTAYFKNTEEGQIAFKKVMNNVKAYTEPVLKMFGSFGKAVMQLFKGEFRGAWETAKSAVQDVGKNIKANREEVGRLNAMEEKYIKFKRSTLLTNKKLEAEIYEQRRIANDEENYSAQERARAIEKALAANQKLADNQRELKELEIDIAKTKASFGDNTIADNDEIMRLEGEIFDITKNQENMSLRLLRNQQRINRELETEISNRQKAVAEAKNMRKALGDSISEMQSQSTGEEIVLDIKTRGDGLDLEDIAGTTPLENLNAELAELKENQQFATSTEMWQQYQAQIEATTAKINAFKGAKEQAMSDTEMIGEMGNQFSVMGNAIGGAAGKMLGFAGTFLQMIPQLITQITALTSAQVASSQSVAAAKGSEALASGTAASQQEPFPLNLVALAATIASIIKALTTKPPKLAQGAVAFGRTLAEVGEYSGARANPEVIAPLDKLRQMLPQQQSEPQVIVGETKVRGDDIYITYQRAQRRANKRT